jgi:hypothetical protein
MPPSLPKSEKIRGQSSLTGKASGEPAALLNGRDADNINARSMLVPPHQTRPYFQPSSNAHLKVNVEGIHEGRALQQRQEKPVSVGWVGPLSGAGTQMAT